MNNMNKNNFANRDDIPPSEFYFAVKQPDLSEDWLEGCCVATVVHKDFWEAEHVVYDGHISHLVNLPADFDEEMESYLSYPGSVKEATDALLKAGFIFNNELQAFFDSSSP